MMISMLPKSFKTCYSDHLDETAAEFLDLIGKSSEELLKYIDDILEKAIRRNYERMIRLPLS